jgi:hypothetical protein
MMRIRPLDASRAKAQCLVIVRILGLFLLLQPMAGCVRLSEGKPPGPWHEAYQPIEHPASESFVSNALHQAMAEFGDPVVPVKQVLLRRSRKVEAARRYRLGEDFSLTECADPTNGIFVIYLAVDPDHRNYFALLGHECAHLINPHLTDWYMEGIATDFSERICRQEQIPWGDWKRHFMRSRREPYALSYRMMQQLREAFPEEYPALVLHAESSVRGGPWLRINIDAWLEGLSEANRTMALEIISSHAEGLRRSVGSQYDFKVPETLE